MYNSLKLSVSVFGLGLALASNVSASYEEIYLANMARAQQAQPVQLPHQGVIVQQQPVQPRLRVPVMQPPVAPVQQPRPASPVAPAAREAPVQRDAQAAPAPHRAPVVTAVHVEQTEAVAPAAQMFEIIQGPAPQMPQAASTAPAQRVVIEEKELILKAPQILELPPRPRLLQAVERFIAPRVAQVAIEEEVQGLVEETIENAGIDNYVEQELVLKPSMVFHFQSAKPENAEMQGLVEETIENAGIDNYVEQDLILKPTVVSHFQSASPESEVTTIMRQLDDARSARSEARAARVAARALEEQNAEIARNESLARQRQAEQRRVRQAAREAEAAKEAKKNEVVELADRIRQERASRVVVAEKTEESRKSPVDVLLEAFEAPVNDAQVEGEVQLIDDPEHADLDAKLKAILAASSPLSSISSSVVSVAEESQVNSLNASLLGSFVSDTGSLNSSVNFPNGAPNGLSKELNDQLMIAISESTPVEPTIAVGLPYEMLDDYLARDAKVDTFVDLASKLEGDFKVSLYGYDSEGTMIYEDELADYENNEHLTLRRALREVRKNNRMLEDKNKVKFLSFAAKSE